jgi:alpha-methylacyl-CoA racemase
LFRTRSRAQWCEILEYSDICFTPILSMAEAPGHPHNIARAAFLSVDGVMQPAPAPSFSATPAVGPVMPQSETATNALLAELGHSETEIRTLKAAQYVG